MSNLDGNLLIDTPENLVLEAEIAGFGSRFMAALIDYIIIYVGLIAFACLFSRSLDLGIDNEEWGVALFFLIQFTIFFFYHLIFEYAMNGQTPGKRQIGLRVVQSNGMPLTTTGLLIRNFVRLVDFLPVYYGVGLLMFFVTPKTQRLGDLAARTIVIREQKKISVRSLQDDYSVRYFHISRTAVPPDYINLAHLTQQDRYTIVGYLQRRLELSNREMIVGPLALRIARVMGIEQMMPIYSPRVAETLLEQIARAFELADQGEWPPRPTVEEPVFDAPIPDLLSPDTSLRESVPLDKPDPPLPPSTDPDILQPPDEPDTSWQRFRLD